MDKEYKKELIEGLETTHGSRLQGTPTGDASYLYSIRKGVNGNPSYVKTSLPIIEMHLLLAHILLVNQELGAESETEVVSEALNYVYGLENVAYEPDTSVLFDFNLQEITKEWSSLKKELFRSSPLRKRDIQNFWESELSMDEIEFE